MKKVRAYIVDRYRHGDAARRRRNPKISPELQGYTATQQVQVIVQYAPGTQLNCNGLLGLVDCLLNDVVKLGGTILGDLPLINGVVALLDGNGIQSSLEPVERRLHQHGPAIDANAQQRRRRGECGVRLAVELHRSRNWRGADRQRREQPSRSVHWAFFLSRASCINSLSCREIRPPATNTATALTSPA